MGDWYRESERTVLESLSAARNGLTGVQAQERLARLGENALEEGKKEKAWQVFLAQFEDLLVIILIAAAVISMLSGDAESTAVILAVITMNAVLGTVQHMKAQKSLDGLKRLSAPRARVRRDGHEQELPATEVVPGDLLILQAGDRAAADGRLLSTNGLQMDESPLTGESEPADKEAGAIRTSEGAAGKLPLAEQRNMIFSGTLVTRGRGEAIVTATGMQTEIGRIASMMSSTEEKRTPLQQNLDRFSSRLAAGIMLICLVVFGLSLYRGMPVMDALLFAVALAVAAIPEAMGSIVTIVQAIGTQQMAREHAVIRDLKAVESLGCVSVICSDKTGTLTQNRMSVQEIFVNGQRRTPAQLSVNDEAQKMLLYAAALANDASAFCREDENYPAGNDTASLPQKSPGDPTELALLELSCKAGLRPENLRRQFPRLAELPFDSERRRMSTLHRIGGHPTLLVKGAPDVLLPRCTSVQSAGSIRELSGTRREQLRRIQREWAGQGMRVLALACRQLSGNEAVALTGDETDADPEQNLVWLGMTAMMDPPRPESRPAVLAAQRAGMRPVMITGDYRVTAEAIAVRVGIFRPGDRSVTGQELDAMTDDRLLHVLPHISVFARVSPEHKIRIVSAWQRLGHLVAMTGDGVNDAPALKKADIGIAMGRSGTQAARDAASMILMDDNFATIIRATAVGRNVYRNICHALEFLLSGNMAGIFCVLCTTFLALPLPFAPVHLLFINLVTDSLPALAIGMEPQEDDLLNRPPRDAAQGILTPGFLAAVLFQGSLIAAGTMAAYAIGLTESGTDCASTMAFAALTLARLFHGFNCRSERPLTELGISGNLWSVMAFETGALLLAAVLILPGLQIMFAAADLNIRQLMAVAALAVLPTILIQIQKIICYHSQSVSSRL